METNLRTNTSLIPHPTTRQLLVTLTEEGWCLPSISMEATHGWWKETSLINQAVRSQYQLDVVTLRCLEIYSPQESKCRIGVFLAEIRDSPHQVPEGMAWLGQEELKNRHCCKWHHQELVDSWFRSEDVPSQPPWTQRGWFHCAEAWINQQLTIHGFTALGRVEQVRSQNYTSCVLRVMTTSGEIYFKASAAHYGYEPALTQALAQEYPDVVPRVLAIEKTEHWMLMEGFRGYPLNQLPSIEPYLVAWEEVLGRFAQIQRDYVPQTQKLLDFGCLDWRLDKLADFIEPWMQELDKVSEPEANYFAKEVETIRAITPQIKSLCAELASYHLPTTIHHGDFHSGNILTDGTSTRVLDWAFQTGVTHPFFSVAEVFAEIEDATMQSRLRDHYLQFWTDYEPMERLLRAFELAQPLAVLHGIIGLHIQMSSVSTIWEVSEQARRIKYLGLSLTGGREQWWGERVVL